MSRSDWFQLLALVVTVAVAAVSGTHFVTAGLFEAKIETLQAEIQTLRTDNEKLVNRPSEPQHASVPEPAPAIRDTGPSASVVCGLRNSLLTLCGTTAETVGDYTFVLMRVDTSGVSERLIVNVQRRGKAAQIIDAFSGQTRTIDEADGRHIVIRSISVEPLGAVIDVSSLRN